MTSDGFDDDNGYDFDETGTELRVTITPRDEVLTELGIEQEEFEQALAEALDAHLEHIETLDESDEIPPVDEMPVAIGEAVYPVRELAVVETEAFGFDEEE